MSPAPLDPKRNAPLPKGAPSNAKRLDQYTLDELKKMAFSRQIPVEKMIAQMIQQYLAEDKKEAEAQNPQAGPDSGSKSPEKP